MTIRAKHVDFLFLPQREASQLRNQKMAIARVHRFINSLAKRSFPTTAEPPANPRRTSARACDRDTAPGENEPISELLTVTHFGAQARALAGISPVGDLLRGAPLNDCLNVTYKICTKMSSILRQGGVFQR